MKLATVKNGTRDGALVVVSQDLTQATSVHHIAPTLQFALDNWSSTKPRLERAAEMLEHGAQPVIRFRESHARSPLPRAFQWLDGSAYLNHVELVRKARNAKISDQLYHEPLMYQGGSDSFLDPRQAIGGFQHSDGIDMEGEVAIIVGDVPMGAARETAMDAILLVMLANDISLRNLIPAELEKGFGFVQSKPSTAFSPVAVTPDELGEHWKDGRLSLPLHVSLNDDALGCANAGIDMTFDFADLIVHAAKTRSLQAGTIIGSGTVSNRADEYANSMIKNGGAGYSCLAEQRMVEVLLEGQAQTQYLKNGDIVRIEMKDQTGRSIFGAIEQRVSIDE